MGDWVVNEGPKWVVMFVYFVINVGLFLGYFFHYQNGEQYYYVRKFVGVGLPFARGAAAALNFNCTLILLPVCRNLISYIRKSCSSRCCRRNFRRQLDKNITFHKWVAYVICFFTAVHAGAHCFNVEFFTEGYDPKINKDEATLLTILSHYGNGNDSMPVNPVRTAFSNPILEAVKLLAGTTGVIITIALILMLSASTEVIRRSYFELFWFTHHLFVVFFICLVIHGMQGVIRSQANIQEHNPEVCSKIPQQWGLAPECPLPVFQKGTAQTWKWILAPMILYFIERCIRFYRSYQKVIITKVVNHPSKVLEIQMQKKGFTMEPGQYVFVQCSKISRLEWHPFTLTSAPEEDYFSLHIRRVGDWTNALAKECHADEGDFQEAWKLPSLGIDGPFGTASEDVFRYQVDVFVAAGIGVTPFASVLKHIWYKSQDPSFESKLQKVYFYWICPDTNAFEWFADLLAVLETQMAEQGKADFLEYNIYLTRGWDSDQAKNIILHEEEGRDVVTGLQQKTNYGRPNWDQIFSGIADQHEGISVGVFFCGPKGLSTTLHKACNHYSSSDPSGIHFFYNKENF